MSAWGLPEGASLSDWCSAYRFAGLDVTIRGGEYVGLWIGDRIVAVDVDAVVGQAILEIAPTPALAYTDRHGTGLLLLATKDIPPSTVMDATPDLGIIARPAVYRLPTGDARDPYRWHVAPDVPLQPLSILLAADEKRRAQPPA